MDITAAFATLQAVADADPASVAEARARRDLFRAALPTEDDVAEVIPSGSLARSTQREPLNDVDVVVLYEAAYHPEWGVDGVSAAAALDHAREQIHRLLGATSGSYEQAVRLASPRNHAIKCFLDDPEEEGAFTVDAMPALRQPGGELLVPEKESQGWIRTHPEFLIGEVARRQAEWDLFRPLVRLLKYWNDCNGKLMKSLVVEVLALQRLPVETTKPRAVQRFFQAAHLAIDQLVSDPADFCGEIQPELDRDAVRDLLDQAASDAWYAVNAQDAGDSDAAACRWRKVFGDAFPEPEGGCIEDEPASGSAGFNIGTGAGAGVGAVGVDRPRKVIDAPQG
jgi:hypothetical protein